MLGRVKMFGYLGYGLFESSRPSKSCAELRSRLFSDWYRQIQLTTGVAVTEIIEGFVHITT